ncbi:hypothetical protein Tco_0495360, partial [Tanacetum coccineum]
VLISVSVSTSYACRVRSAARNPAFSICCASTVVPSALTSERVVSLASIDCTQAS